VTVAYDQDIESGIWDNKVTKCTMPNFDLNESLNDDSDITDMNLIWVKMGISGRVGARN
jgi:hypothetical protein